MIDGYSLNEVVLCEKLLELNGWKFDENWGVYVKEHQVAVEFYMNELVLIDGTGDFLHIPVNYYALVGALIECKQISVNYKNI